MVRRRSGRVGRNDWCCAPPNERKRAAGPSGAWPSAWTRRGRGAVEKRAAGPRSRPAARHGAGAAHRRRIRGRGGWSRRRWAGRLDHWLGTSAVGDDRAVLPRGRRRHAERLPRGHRGQDGGRLSAARTTPGRRPAAGGTSGTRTRNSVAIEIHPLQQFEIERIIPLHIGGIDISYTNSALMMTIVVVGDHRADRCSPPARRRWCPADGSRSPR